MSAARAYEALELVIADGVATVRLDRPAARNALNQQLKSELSDVIALVAHDPGVRAVRLTGNGPAFCAGGDITEMDPDRTPDAARTRMRNIVRDIYLPLAQLEKPVVAAVNGHAHGAGVSLALATDIVVASDTAILSLAFARVGVVPDSGALYFLSRQLGRNQAKELLFTGRRLSADEAREAGLINRVVPHDELEAESDRLARELASGPTVALGLAKRLLDQAPSMSFEDMAELEGYAQGIAMSTRDHREAVAAFSEKREPVFTGE
jgi:2-(1,2-epoxy-1,2-dihydrophenyl)acetyl-CoA isomerase